MGFGRCSWPCHPRDAVTPLCPPVPSSSFHLGSHEKCHHGALAAPGASGCRAGGFYRSITAARACQVVRCELPVGLLWILSPSPSTVAQGELSRPPPCWRAGGMRLMAVGPRRSGGGEGQLWPSGEALCSQLLAWEPRASEGLSKGYKPSPASGPSEASPAPAPPPAAWPGWQEGTRC